MKSLFSVLTFTILCSAVTALPGQTLAFSTRSNADTGIFYDEHFDPLEIISFDPTTGLPCTHRFNSGNLNSMFGDVDSNLLFDDFDRSIDAMSLPTPGDDGGVLGLFLSLSQNTTALGGINILDGDVFSLHAGGIVQIEFLEADFANVTSTTTVDIDAFHLAADGSCYFSFANDENTTSANLIAANGGNASLDETTVFYWPIGSTEAQIYLDRNAILAHVNQALGTSLTTVVDVTGFTDDPNSPGEFLFTLGSANSTIEGRVFSTNQGGSLAQWLGQAIDSTTFGFVTEEILEGLAHDPLGTTSLQLFPPDHVASPANFHSYGIAGASPGSQIHLFAAHSLFPIMPATQIIGLSGFSWLYVNDSDPFFATSVASLSFSAYSDAAGRCQISFDVSNLPLGLRINMQAVDSRTLMVSAPTSAGL